MPRLGKQLVTGLIATVAVVALAFALQHTRDRRGDAAAALDLPDEPAALAARIEELGPETAVELYGNLRQRLAEPHDDARRTALAAMDRLAAVLAQRYLLPEYARDVVQWRAMPAIETRAVAAHLVRLDTVFRDGQLGAEAVRDTLTADLAWLRARKNGFGIVLAENYLATNARRRGRDDEARAWSRQYLADARRWGLRLATGDALCVLAMHGVAESEVAVGPYLEEALVIARESRLAGLAGRVHAVAGILAHEQGRFAQECDHFEEAVQVCRELGQPARGLPFMALLMQFYAAFGDWDRVEELMPRAEALVGEARALAAAGLGRDKDRVECDRLRIDELRARTLLARGRVAEAQAIYPGLLAATRELPFQDTAYVHDRRCLGLLAAGQPAAALAAAREALAYAASVPHPSWTMRYRLHEARALLACGDTAAAVAGLAAFDSAAVNRDTWVNDLLPAACLVRAAVAEAHAGTHAGAHTGQHAADVLAAGLADLVDGFAAGDASSRAYLDLARADAVRLALHDALAPSATTQAAETGYGLELFWRRLPFWLGDRHAAPPRDGRHLVEVAVGYARDAQARLRAAGAIHCLYAHRGERILRWTAGAAGVRCDTLAVSRTVLAAQVGGALALLGADPGDPRAPVSAELAARLRDLAEVLLPATMWEPGAPRTFYVSAEGELALLPFAALNVGTPPDYAPLIGRADVATLRAGGHRETTAAGSASLVVAAPEVAPRLRRLYPGLGELAGGAREAERVASLLAPAEVLLGPQATRDALTRRWGAVDCLYFAGHAVRSAEAPYRTFLPLSATAGDALGDDSSLLDVNDIRAADLGRVKLAVLSSCASGAPYVSGQAAAPSLGDVFLDAGAAAVVQTLWKVRDDASPQLLTDFLSAWRGDGRPLPAAFGGAQRAAAGEKMRAGLHPFGWAAYTLNLRALD